MSEQKVFAFYVNGSSIGGSDPAHSTPWGTITAARTAAQTYTNEVNEWYQQFEPGGTYVDPPVEDTVHAGVRVGVLPSPDDDGHPAAPAGSVELPWGDGTAWQSL